MITIKTIHLIHGKVFCNLGADRVNQEDVMSCLEYEEMENEESATEAQGPVARRKTLVVMSDRAGAEDYATRRAAEVLDLELAQGSMPT